MIVGYELNWNFACQLVSDIEIFFQTNLGTQSKKNKYENSEYVPISINPPTSEGYSEQKDSELWCRF